jgi:hypothetical protein
LPASDPGALLGRRVCPEAKREECRTRWSASETGLVTDRAATSAAATFEAETETEPISPELVLVTPELRPWAVLLLPAPRPPLRVVPVRSDAVLAPPPSLSRLLVSAGLAFTVGAAMMLLRAIALVALVAALVAVATLVGDMY